MSPSEGAFCFFTLLVVLSALGIVITKNVIHGALMLVVVLLGLAALFVLFRSHYLAVVQVMVYAGGIVVLMAFGMMLTNQPVKGKRLLRKRYLLSVAVLVSAVGLCFLKILSGFRLANRDIADATGQIAHIGVRLMSEYLLAFELIAFLLLVVLVGAAYLAKKQAEVD